MTIISNTLQVTSGSVAVADVVSGGVVIADFDATTIGSFISSGGGRNAASVGGDRPATLSHEARPNNLRREKTSALRADLQKRRARTVPRAPVAALDQQLQMVFNALSLAGIAIALLDSCGIITLANEQFAALLPCLPCVGSGRRRLADRAANSLIAEALKAFAVASANTSPRAIPMRGSDGRLVAVGHVMPINSMANGAKAAGAILIAHRAGPCEAPSAALLQRVFGLSPAEARVARGIVEGRTVASMAVAFGVSRETVRSQLKRVLAKSGADRQVDLAVLLSGLKT